MSFELVRPFVLFCSREKLSNNKGGNLTETRLRLERPQPLLLDLALELAPGFLR